MPWRGVSRCRDGWEPSTWGSMLIVGHRSPADVTKRLDRLIKDIRTRFHDNAIGKPKGEAPICDVVLVAHGHILRAFSMRWIGRELTDGVSLLLEGMLVISARIRSHANIGQLVVLER